MEQQIQLEHALEQPTLEIISVMQMQLQELFLNSVTGQSFALTNAKILGQILLMISKFQVSLLFLTMVVLQLSPLFVEMENAKEMNSVIPREVQAVYYVKNNQAIPAQMMAQSAH